MARRFAEPLAREPDVSLLNDVALNAHSGTVMRGSLLNGGQYRASRETRGFWCRQRSLESHARTERGADEYELCLPACQGSRNKRYGVGRWTIFSNPERSLSDETLSLAAHAEEDRP
jgi:hypothetical protein